MKKHLIEKYGPNYKQVLWSNKGNSGQNRRAYYFMKKSTAIEPLFSEEEYVYYKAKDKKHLFKFRCKKCGTDFLSIWDNGHAYVCPTCSEPKGISEEEKNVGDFIQRVYGGKILRNDRTLIRPYELDIVIPDKKIAIEYDGLYWHSDININNPFYHLNKTDMCLEKDFKLIHIFENEWKHNRENVMNLIKGEIGIFSKIINSEDCEMKLIDSKEANEFHCKNNIFGKCISSINIALIHNNKIIFVMSFSKNRFNKKYEWELQRETTLSNFKILNSFEECLNFFIKTYKPKNIVKYLDRRYFNNETYEKNNFKIELTTRPDYFYIDFSKGILKNRIEIEKNKYSTQEFNKIYDCGNYVLVKNIV